MPTQIYWASGTHTRGGSCSPPRSPACRTSPRSSNSPKDSIERPSTWHSIRAERFLEAKPEQVATALEPTRNELATLSNLVGERSWLAGDRISAADIAIFPFVRLLLRAGSMARGRASSACFRSPTGFQASLGGLRASRRCPRTTGPIPRTGGRSERTQPVKATPRQKQKLEIEIAGSSGAAGSVAALRCSSQPGSTRPNGFLWGSIVGATCWCSRWFLAARITSRNP